MRYIVEPKNKTEGFFMKKTVSIITISLLTATTLAIASPNTKGDMGTMNKADSQILFGGSSANVVALGSDEISVTEGKWGWKSFLRVVAIVVPIPVIATLVTARDPRSAGTAVWQASQGNYWNAVNTGGKATIKTLRWLY